LRPEFRLGSIPIIENSEPNLGKGWEAAIRSNRPNDAGAPVHLSFATPKGKPRERRGDASYQPRDGGWRNRQALVGCDIATMIDAEK
jgi:hypothetical protein